jgi:tetratricopeptide (TPR) repeat protein
MYAVTGATTLEVSARRAGPSKAARDALLRAFSSGDHDAAISSAREIVAAYPGAALAWKILAASLGTVGTLAEAIAAARRATEIAPRDAEAHRNLAALLQRAGAREAAIGSFRVALVLAPDHAPSYRHLGALLREAGLLEEAETHGRTAVHLAPAEAENHHALGVTLQLRDRPADAEACHRAAIARAPGHGAAYRNLGVALKELGRLEEALAALDRAVALRPDDAEAHNNRAVILEELGRFAEALTAIDRALELRPAYAEAHANRGAILVDLRRFAEALDSHDRALGLAPGDIGAEWNRSLALLSLGRMREGWALHERRWNIRGAQTPRATSRPRWTGAPGQEIAGRTILLWGEQGLGDQIQFARFAALVAARGAQVLLETAPRLAPLLDGLAGVARVVRSDARVPDEAFDFHCPLMSLPAVLGTELSTIPADIPFLRVPEPARARWAATLGPASRPRVGIAWSGNPAHANDARRSIPLSRLGALLGAPVEWIGLQRELRDSDRAALHALPQLRHSGAAIADFTDTAALCAACDLVIAVDTSVAHLAGALGRPLWILLPFNADWRWLHDRVDSPWYPTARLHRQERPGDWDGTLARVADDLAAWIGARATAGGGGRVLDMDAGELRKSPAGDRALARDRDPAVTRDLRGLALVNAGRLDAALACFEESIAQRPDDAGAWFNRGAVLVRMKRADEALACFERAIALRPAGAHAHAARGVLLEKRGQLVEALAACDRAIALQPDFADAHCNRGLVLRAMGRTGVAVAAYARAIALDPRHGQARYNRALALLALGRFEEGWQAHESRWQRPGAPPPRVTARPRWTGAEPLEGRRLLLVGEQGIGDQIMFLRFAPLLAARGATVIAEIDPALARLCEGLDGVARAVATSAPLGDAAFDLHCPLMSLPAVLGTRLATIPAMVPYLRVPASAIAAWSDLPLGGATPRIGVAWSGNPAHANDRNRSLALARLATLFDARATWVSLQCDVRPEDRATLDSLPQLAHAGARLTDFADTAALCASCDLVIAVDTSVAHLAGALGRPVWILLPFAADWRWLSDRTDSPWYPTARLYRQERPGDWDGVLARVAGDLAAWIGSRAGVMPPVPARAVPSRAEIDGLVRSYRRGDQDDALRRADAILAQAPDTPVALKIRAALLVARGAPEAALATMERAVAAAPGDAEAWRNLAMLSQRLGHADAAIAAWQRAVALEPGRAADHGARARLLHAAGRREEAADSYAQALRLEPDDAGRRNDHAVVLFELGWLDEAEEALRAAVACAPADVHAHVNLALLLRHRGRMDEAITAQARAADLSPGQARPWVVHADMLVAAHRAEEALASYRHAIAADPDNADIHVSLGLALRHVGRLEEAVASFAAALDRAPESAPAHLNLGVALGDLGRIDAALASHARARALAPGEALVDWNIGLLMLETGAYRAGWPLYERRWRLSGAKPPRATARPLWLGDPDPRGRTILLWGEQGFGDQIQFLRFAPLVAARGARVLLEVDRDLLRLVRRGAGISTVAAADTPCPDTAFDLHCPLMSLPLALGIDLDAVPPPGATIAVPSGFEAKWAERIGTRPRPRIGIAWSGNPTHANDARRSIPLARLAGLLDPAATWISLQRHVRDGDRASLEDLPELLHFGDGLGDFADTAALCAQCDLVIAVDTSVVHLAGALGRPVWILLPFAADWRWLRGRTDSPWYPTARLYRQERPGDWDGVLALVARDLAAWIAASATDGMKPPGAPC